MLSYQDTKWAAMTIDTRKYRTKTPEQQAAALAKDPPNFLNRTAIRSIWDGRYRFSRYFSPIRFNAPGSLEELFAMNDVEVYDLHDDPGETNNLAIDPKRNGDLIVALNQETNRRIAEEVGPGRWQLPADPRRQMALPPGERQVGGKAHDGVLPDALQGCRPVLPRSKVCDEGSTSRQIGPMSGKMTPYCCRPAKKEVAPVLALA